MGVIGAGPEPDRSCQCKGPECVTESLVNVSCKNEMDEEDLLCHFCREHRDVKHCHVFSKKCPEPIPAANYEDKPYHLPSMYDDYLEHIVEYARKRYG